MGHNTVENPQIVEDLVFVDIVQAGCPVILTDWHLAHKDYRHYSHINLDFEAKFCTHKLMGSAYMW